MLYRSSGRSWIRWRTGREMCVFMYIFLSDNFMETFVQISAEGYTVKISVRIGSCCQERALCSN